MHTYENSESKEPKKEKERGPDWVQPFHKRLDYRSWCHNPDEIELTS